MDEASSDRFQVEPLLEQHYPPADEHTQSACSPIKLCPLCGSQKFKLLEPDTFQARGGIGCVLKCECGGIVSMNVLKKPRLDSATPTD